MGMEKTLFLGDLVNTDNDFHKLILGDIKVVEHSNNDQYVHYLVKNGYLTGTSLGIMNKLCSCFVNVEDNRLMIAIHKNDIRKSL
jgi:hypothetical protein